MNEILPELQRVVINLLAILGGCELAMRAAKELAPRAVESFHDWQRRRAVSEVLREMPRVASKGDLDVLRLRLMEQRDRNPGESP